MGGFYSVAHGQSPWVQVEEMAKYLIWDFDGTLGYRVGMWSGALIEVLRRNIPGIEVNREQVQPFLQEGFPWHTPHHPHLDIQSPTDWWNRLDPLFERTFTQGVGLDLPRAQTLSKKIREVYLHPSTWKLYDDTIPALQTLSLKGWTHLILSNHVPELKIILAALQLDQHFELVFNSAETGYEKPHPLAFQRVLQRVGDYTSIWMIGDSFTADIIGAKQAGIPGILVRRNHPEAELQCNTLSQLAALVS
jgi:putative hydrolase of the HAD superfamily